MAKGASKEGSPTHFSIMRQVSGPPFSVALETARIRSQMRLEVEKQEGAASEASLVALAAANRRSRGKTAGKKSRAKSKPTK